MTRYEKMYSSIPNVFGAIFDCIEKRNPTLDEIARLKELKNNSVEIAGRTISCYAFTALHLLGIEEYRGDNFDILDLISQLS